MYTIASRTQEDPYTPYVYSFIGKSSYPKPAYPDIATGSSLYNIDTQEVFMFDADTDTWVLQ